MTFFQRFITLARADAHGMLDSLEDRSLILKQCLREAELAIRTLAGEIEGDRSIHSCLLPGSA